MKKARTSAAMAVLPFLFRHWMAEKQKVGLTFLAICIATAADLLLPLYSGHFIDALAHPGSARTMAVHTALRALACIAILGLLLVLGRYGAFLSISRLSVVIMPRLASRAFWRVQHLSTDWHANNFAGSNVRRITRGMWATDLLDATILLSLTPALLVLVGSSLLLALRWPGMGVIVATGAVIYITTSVSLTLGYVAPAARLSNAQDSRIDGTMSDTLSCNPVVKAFAAESREKKRLDHALSRWARLTFVNWMRGTHTGALQLSILLLLRLSVIFYALLLWWWGLATPGDVTFVITLYFVVQAYLGDIGQQAANLQRGINEMEEMVALESEPLGVADPSDATPIQICQGDIRFEHVTFRYAGQRKPFYQNLTLHIPAGQRLGLVGHSGSGKTTLVKLLHRLYNLEGGKIIIDGQDIAYSTQYSVRAQIALVPQDPILFHRSLAENIAYGRPNSTQEEIELAAIRANAHEFICRQPEGYATPVGERGVKLSGGERQRIALARAFLANTPILILDEATSSLDSESEALIQQAIERLLKGRTSIVIAHRLSTVRMLDRIMVFDHGHIVEDGTHDSLIANSHGTYRRLYDKQVAGMIAELATDMAGESNLDPLDDERSLKAVREMVVGI